MFVEMKIFLNITVLWNNVFSEHWFAVPSGTSEQANLVNLVSSVKLYCSDTKVLSVVPVTHEFWPCSRGQLALLNQLYFTRSLQWVGH